MGADDWGIEPRSGVWIHGQVLVVIMVATLVIGFCAGWLANDARSLCALDRTGKQVCVTPQPEGPNALEVEP